jgi:hypothetical protein
VPTYTNVEESYYSKENANYRNTLCVRVSGQDPWPLSCKLQFCSVNFMIGQDGIM